MSVDELPRWQDNAACRGRPVELFEWSRDKQQMAKARAICAECPVFADCRAYVDEREDGATDVHFMDMIYAGETPPERRARRQAERKQKR